MGLIQTCTGSQSGADQDGWDVGSRLEAIFRRGGRWDMNYWVILR